MISFSIKNSLVGIWKILSTYFIEKVIGSIVLSGFFFDPLKDGMLHAIIVLSLFDVVLGCLLAYRGGRLTVSQAVKGSAIKVVTYVMLVSTSYITSSHVPDFGIFNDLVIYYVILSETISIFESANSLGISVPFIKNLRNLRKHYEEFS